MVRLFALAVILFVFKSCFAKNDELPWSYTDASTWGELSPSYAECKLGKHQSPIDIQTSQTHKSQLKAIVTAYKPAVAEIVNNGHTIQVNLSKAGGVVLQGGSYELLQFHFHTPSEELIDGKSFPLVAHLVHKNKMGDLAVIAVLFEEGVENQAIAPIFSAMPLIEGRMSLTSSFDATSLLPSNLDYYQFMGSLTTPPCNEGVSWQVLKTPVSISPSQIKRFHEAYKMNARPIQPLNGRVIQSSS